VTISNDGESTLPRELFNERGESFEGELDELQGELDQLDNDDRRTYRDANARFISQHPSKRILIVAGPGSGKSFLFLKRIQNWLIENDSARIYVSTFVRKLVKDLQSEVSIELEEIDANRVTVSTLHGLARSILERSRGSANHRRVSNINVVSEEWMNTIWNDVAAFHGSLSTPYTNSNFFKMFKTDVFDEENPWSAIAATYETISHFYNSVGFNDMIVLAREAIDERPELIQHSYWIFDEFQDFNVSENHLIQSLTATAEGVLIAGDDEQALYQKLKQSHPGIIISYYEDSEFANAMLPFCSRCGYWICLAASSFIAASRAAGSIKKIYLPLFVDETAPKVQLVATPTPASEVDYIQRFIVRHRAELDEHITRMAAGEETDPFLLILTPDKKLKLLATGGADENLRSWLAEWSAISSGRSDDYRRIQAYCSAVGVQADNWVFRRVLFYEGHSSLQVQPLIELALNAGCKLAELEDRLIEEAMARCHEVSSIVEHEEWDWTVKVQMLSEQINIRNLPSLITELESNPISGGIFATEEEADEAIETAGAAAAVELLTLVGSKGLSSKHVIVMGCDNINLNYTTRLAFFVAMTRARESLHLITSLKSRGCVSAHTFVDEIPDAYCEFLLYKKTGHELTEIDSRREWNNQIARWIPKR